MCLWVVDLYTALASGRLWNLAEYLNSVNRMTTSSIPMDSIDALIAKQVPAWMRDTSIEKLRALHRALRQQETNAQHLRQLIQFVPTLEAFATPLLEKAMQDRFAVEVDARRSAVQSVRRLAQPPVVASLSPPYRTLTTEQNLLTAALLNFTVDETKQNAFVRSTLRTASNQALEVGFEEFARLCRELDLGGKYQRVLGERLRPQRADGTPDEAARKVVLALLEEAPRAQLDVTIRLAALKGQISQRTYRRLLPVAARDPIVPSDPAVLTPRQVMLLGKTIFGVIAFEVRARPTDASIESLIVWIPDDPIGALQLHGSWSAFYLALGLRLRKAQYREFFMRFIGERDRAAFVMTLNQLAAMTAPSTALQLDGRHRAIEQPLFQYLGKQRIDTIFDDARVLAVPTDDENRQTQVERQQAYLDAGLSLLNLAGFVVPGLGLAMLGVAAVQIADEVYEGYQDWQLGDRQAALGHLFGIAENMVATAALSAGGAVIGRVLERSRFVDGLYPICTEAGRFKLCADDLGAYEVQDTGLAVGQQGRVDERTHLRLHDATYQIRTDELKGTTRIVHPQRGGAHEPLLEHNGAGGWRHAMEQPHYWTGEGHALRRLGRRFCALSDEGARAVLQSTGFTVGRLRRLHVENAPPPARLLDAAQRYELHEQFPALRDDAFEEVFASRQVVPDEAQRLLRRDFTGLTARGAQEIVERASGEQVEQMLANHRVPLALAEQARWLSRDSRLDRACAGLRQASAVTADTEKLALGLIENLAPWPATVRVELREGSPDGALKAQTGSLGASQVLHIYRRGRGYRTMLAPGHAQPVSSGADSLMSSLLLCLDDRQKRLLGSVELDEAGLINVLAHKAGSQRELASRLIGQTPVGIGVRPPVRWGDGRLGYPLSGRAESSRQAIRRSIREVFPGMSDNDIEHYLLEVSSQHTDLWAHTHQLHEHLDSLREGLQQWQGQHTGVFDRLRRQRVANALRRCWRREIPEHLNGGFALTIDGERVGNLPILPTGLEFPHVTRLRLRNMSLTALNPDFLQRFRNLVELDLRDNRLRSIPSGIEHLAQLEQLHLNNNQIVMDAGGNRRLATLTRLRQLDLSHNPLGQAPELQRLLCLREVSLRFTGLTELPVGAQNLPWGGMTDLRNNRLRHLRQDVHSLRIRLQGRAVHDNPLIETDTASGEHVSEDDASGGVTLSSHRIVDEVAREQWLVDSVGELRTAREGYWATLRDVANSDDFFRFLADFADTSDFHAHPVYYRARIWTIMEACAQNEELCNLLFTQVSGPRTCQDRLLLMLSHLETRIYVNTVTAGLPLAEQEEYLMRVGRSLFRLDEVDRAASRHIELMRRQNRINIDDIEVYLTYRVRLAGPLGLPAQPSSLHYEMFSGVTSEDINNARLAVFRAETRESVCESLAERDFWQEYLHYRYPERFEAMTEPFHTRLALAEEASAQSGEQAYVEQSNRLMQEMNAAERALLLTLTEEAYARLPI